MTTITELIGGTLATSSVFNVWMLPVAAPSGDAAVIDLDMGASGYLRVKLTSSLHLLMEAVFNGNTTTGNDIAGGSPLPALGQWYWISCGLLPDGSNPGLIAASGGTWTHNGVALGSTRSATLFTAALAGSQYSFPAGLAFGTALTSGYANNPNDGSRLYFSKPEQYDRVGAPLSTPLNADRAAGAVTHSYNCEQTVGAAASLTDQGSGALNLTSGSGTNSLVIALAGPYLT